MTRNNVEISEESNGRSISSIADEIMNLDIPEYITGSDDGQQLNNYEKCEANFKGIIYSCQQCNYKATQKGHVKQHRESKHEGVKYVCYHCEYQATTRDSL